MQDTRVLREFFTRYIWRPFCDYKNYKSFRTVLRLSFDIYPSVSLNRYFMCKSDVPINTKVGHGKKYLEAKASQIK